MTDPTPPPTDRKPRRRSAPRKRSAPKRSEKPEAAAVVESSVEADGAGIASSPDAVAARLDPKPLADAGDRGDAPAGDSPLAGRDDPRRDAAPRASRGSRAKPAREAKAQGDAAGIEAPGSAEAKRATDAPTAPASVPEPASASVPAPAPAPTVAAAVTFPRQAELRPGELIRVPLSVRWRDLDAFNHVNNSKYLSYLEEARLRWMLAMPGMGMDDDVAPVVAASNLNYRRPIEWPGDVVIELFVERTGGSSLTIGHRIVDSKDGGTLYCDGHVVMVWIDRNSGRSAPLPESVRAACR
jgi:YbgC/YbaW family acyl-CoA thioester hydrolase